MKPKVDLTDEQAERLGTLKSTATTYEEPVGESLTERRLHQIDEVLESLRIENNELHDRLQPVLKPLQEETIAQDSMAPDSEESELTIRLESILTRVRLSTIQVTSIRDRLTI